MPQDLPTRVITALQRDPVLLWEVAQSLFKVLGPWEKSADEQGVFWERSFPNRVFALRISEMTDDVGGATYWWSRMDVLGDAIEQGDLFTTLVEAAREADACMEGLGYTLVPSVPQR